MSVSTKVKLPTPPPTGMAAKYERAYNEVVMEQPEWKQKIINNNFNMVSGHMVYGNRRDQELVHDVMKQVILRAENDY
tara:strand:- start:1046 stop:1279 length:234 start_codon:yes stop_codon:yes gene_type:complete